MVKKIYEGKPKKVSKKKVFFEIKFYINSIFDNKCSQSCILLHLGSTSNKETLMKCRPVHADGFSAAQLLFPRLIQLRYDLLSFLSAIRRQVSQTERECGGLRFEHFRRELPSYLEPLNGLLTGRAEDAVVQVAD